MRNLIWEFNTDDEFGEITIKEITVPSHELYAKYSPEVVKEIMANGEVVLRIGYLEAMELAGPKITKKCKKEIKGTPWEVGNGWNPAQKKLDI